MARKELGCGLFYTRDSGGKHETTPSEYIQWAQRRAKELKVSLRATTSDIEAMIRNSEYARGDIYLDFEVSGHQLSRKGLNALINRGLNDLEVSHVFIPRRDRFARPNDPIDAVKLENVLRESGLTLVFMGQICEPLVYGRRYDIGELITAMFDYDSAGKFRRELSEKMVFCQIALAKAGFSTGGRPPFAFDRWLAKEDGTAIRQLEDGEIIRMARHHVVWLPAKDERLEIALRIRKMLLTTPASRVARILNAEGIPSPDAKRFRTDGGVHHAVSGLWHQTTVANIGRNPLLAAVLRHGVRSMGDQTRFTPDGPRDLTKKDRHKDGKPKVCRNPEKHQIQVSAKFDPVVSLEEHKELNRILDARAGTQRGKPRARDSRRNPLGLRVFDIDCTWPMYRVQQGSSFRYKCGLYMQSHGQQCAHNHIDGPTAARFVLSCIRQSLLSPSVQSRVETRLRELAEAESSNGPQKQAAKYFERIRRELKSTDDEIEKVGRNMALAEDENQYRAVAAVFRELTARRESQQQQLAEAEVASSREFDLNSEVEGVMRAVHELTQLASDSSGLEDTGELFRLTNANLFLKFEKVTLTKRIVNRLRNGVVTFGSAASPIRRYAGPTSSAQLKAPKATKQANTTQAMDQLKGTLQINSGEGGKSLRNVSRDDRI